MTLDSSDLLRRTKAALPTAGVLQGVSAFATDGRKVGEGASAGTGVLVWAAVTAGTVTWVDYRTGLECLT